jgi:hypothetical protein
MPGRPNLRPVGYVRFVKRAEVKPEGGDHRLFDNRAGFRFRLTRRDVAFHADMDDPFSGLGKLGISAVGCCHLDNHLKLRSADNRL